jgi:8-oxo-dGTP pyrophosphatase MutT (NUDIX family)
VISLIKNRLERHKPQDIHCARSSWAGVVIPIFEKGKEVFIILTKRTQTVTMHKGEVSFPGGMYEDKDGDRINTATRECCEEIGIEKKDIEIIGRLDDMYTMTGFCIRPYVGVVPFPYDFKTSPDEVAYLIYLPLAYLKGVKPLMEEAERSGHIEKVPSFYYEGDRIWGATCRILLHLSRIVENETV